MGVVRQSLCALALILCVACDEKQSLEDGGNAPNVKDGSIDPSKDASPQQQVDASKPDVDQDAGAAQETKDAGRLAKSVGHVQFQLLGVQ